MIKAKAENIIILGLSNENMKRLADNQPIKFNLKDLGLQDMEVIIFNGETEESMYLDMLELIDINKTKLI